MQRTQLYHTRDPIENLCVHVTLRKIVSAAGEDASAIRVGTTWGYSFRWQEKKRTTVPDEARATKKTKKMSKSTARNADAIDNDATNATNPQAARSSVLGSYIDADNFVPAEELTRSFTTAASGGTTPTHLASAQHRRVPLAHGLAAVVPSLSMRNTERAWRRRDREESFRCMHLVASLDGDNDHILCSLQFYATSGLLCASPGFSVPIDVDSESIETITSKGGPKLSTYRVAIDGALFEYALDNVNDLVPLAAPQDESVLRELLLRDHKQDEACVAARQAREGGCGSNSKVNALAQVQQLYLDAMRASGVVKRKLVLVEVVSACDLSATEPVRVELRLRLPRSQQRQHASQYWRLRKPAAAAATATTTMRSRLAYVRRTASGATATVFNLHAQFDLELCRSVHKTSLSGRAASSDDNDDAWLDSDSGELLAVASPMLSLRVISRDSWGRRRLEGGSNLAVPRTPGRVDCSLALVKPVRSVHEQLEELFLGMSDSGSDSDSDSDDDSDDSEEGNDEMLHAGDTTLRGVNSRLGVHVQPTSASVRVRINTVDQLSSTAATRAQYVANCSAGATTQLRRPHAAALPELLVVKRSVNEILQSVRLEKRLQQSVGGSSDSSYTVGATTTTATSVAAVLARLQTTRTPQSTTSSMIDSV